MKKCGTCIYFFVKPNEMEIARHAPHISECQPGKPHCLGGQVRGACQIWEARRDRGYPMPNGNGPMVDSTFVCPLWEEGGPSAIRGSRNTSGKSVNVKAGASLALGIVLSLIAGKSEGSGNNEIMLRIDEPGNVWQSTLYEFVKNSDLSFSDIQTLQDIKAGHSVTLSNSNTLITRI